MTFFGLLFIYSKNILCCQAHILCAKHYSEYWGISSEKDEQRPCLHGASIPDRQGGVGETTNKKKERKVAASVIKEMKQCKGTLNLCYVNQLQAKCLGSAQIPNYKCLHRPAP